MSIKSGIKWSKLHCLRRRRELIHIEELNINNVD